MNEIYTSFGITIMGFNGNIKSRNVLRKELFEAIDKQIKWEMDRTR